METFDEAAVVAEITASNARFNNGGNVVVSSPTKKSEAAAASRKESALRAVLLQQRLRGYDAAHLVRPICGSVFRVHNNSTPTQLRLALAILRGCKVSPEDENELAETIRSGIASGAGGGGAFEGNLGGAGGTGTGGGGGGSPRYSRPHSLEAHFQLLMRAPPRLAAAVIWSERNLIERYVAGDASSGDNGGGGANNAEFVAGESVARAAAVAAIGRVLSRAAALAALSSAAPEGADATGACGEGARLAQALWCRVLAIVSGAGGEAAAPTQVCAAAFNALALLMGEGA